MTALPESGATTTALDADGALWLAADLEDVSIEGGSLRRLRAAGGTWTRSTFMDCTFEGADLAGAVTRDCSLVRCSLDGARMTGSQWLRSRWREVSAHDLTADSLTAHHSAWTGVTITGSRLRELDLSDASLERVRFVDCDLTGARFAGTRCADVRFTGCTLSAITGVTGLRGAALDWADGVSALDAIAAELGIGISGQSDP